MNRIGVSIGTLALVAACAACGPDTAGSVSLGPGSHGGDGGDAYAATDPTGATDPRSPTDSGRAGDAPRSGDPAPPAGDSAPFGGDPSRSGGDGQPYRPTPVAAADGCAAPTYLDVSAGPATVITAIPAGADGAANACGLAPAPDGYFAVTVGESSRLAVAASGTHAVTVGLFANHCQPSAPMAPCAAGVIADVDAGTYLIGVIGQAGTDLTLSVTATPLPPPPPEWPPHLDGSDICASATPLVLADGRATVQGKLPTSVDVDLAVACGQSGSTAGAYYVVSVLTKGTLSATVVSQEDVWVGLLPGSCPPATSLGSCGMADFAQVSPGTYLVAVGGHPGGSYDLVVDWQPTPPVPGSCAAPIPITLNGNSAALYVDFTTAPNDQHGTCGSTTYPERAYELHVTTPSDLTLVSSGSYFYAWVRSGSCAGGTQLACSSLSYSTSTVLAPNLAPGTYYLFLQEYSSSSASLTVRLDPPPSRPANDTCAGATPLTFVGTTATVTQAFAGAVADGAGTTCGGPRHLYYSVTLDAPAQLSLDVDTYSVDTQLSSGACGSQTAIKCNYSDSSLCVGLLPAETYTLRLGESGSTVTSPVTLTVKRQNAYGVPVNDTCGSAQPITLTSGTASVVGTLLGAQNDASFGTGCSVYSSGGQEVFYSLTLDAKSDVTLTTSGNYAAYMGTWLLGGGCAGPTVIGCGGSGQHLYEGVAAGAYLIAVEWTEGLSSSSCRDASTDGFSLQVLATPSPPPPANDTCATAEAVSLTTVGSLAAIAGTTAGATNDQAQILCPGSSYTTSVLGHDVVYAVTTGTLGVLKVTPVSSPNNLVLYLTSPCGDDTAWACRQSYGGSLSTGFAIPAGTYYLTVDQSATGAGSAFTLLAELAAP